MPYPREHRKAGKQPVLQRHDQFVVCVIALGALHCLHTQVCHGSQGGLQFGAKSHRVGPCETDRPEQSAVETVERQRGGRLNPGCAGIGPQSRKLCLVRGQIRQQDNAPSRAAAAMGYAASSGTSLY